MLSLNSSWAAVANLRFRAFPCNRKLRVLDSMGDRLECLATSPAAVATRQVMKASAEQAFVNMFVCSITVAAVEQPCGPVVACHLRFFGGQLDH